ncbi:MAG: hypothetical protein EI684_05870 [Candidatus Viridilinea halotolerans]|uniref:Band 7 domain-containing protein n=1 Tax=Candidatus Viridilinea halotolerans TaxID=2491704 RepID=A0A426U4W1_9CHLR|nr:MAG: hypothetical protein EI684_05870 [Candidatus Viridilinea halotolerans]
MTTANRFWPVVGLAGIVVFAYTITLLLDPINPWPSFVLLSVLGLLVLMLTLGGGWREVEPGYAIIRRDTTGNFKAFSEGYYLFVPFLHTIEAVMPNYPVRYEDEIERIQTRTFRVGAIEKMRVRVNYHIFNHVTCYTNLVPTMADRIRELEQHERLKRTETRIWLKALDEALHQRVDDSVRDEIWAWSESLEHDDRLTLQTPFPAPAGAEYDPYGLSLNRQKLAQKVRDDINRVVARYGLRVDQIVFELIELNYEFIKARTENRDRDLAKAVHEARIAAAAIREKGFAEAEVRAHNLALLLDELINKRGLSIQDTLVGEIVRAAFYSDGEMIWQAALQQPKSDGPTKAA